MYLLLTNEYKTTICKKETLGSQECCLPYFEGKKINWLPINNATKSYELARVFCNIVELLDWLGGCQIDRIDGAFSSNGRIKNLIKFLKEDE